MANYKFENLTNIIHRVKNTLTARSIVLKMYMSNVLFVCDHILSVSKVEASQVESHGQSLIGETIVIYFSLNETVASSNDRFI